MLPTRNARGLGARSQVALLGLALLIAGSYAAAMFAGLFGGILVPPANWRIHILLLLVIAYVCGMHTIVFGHSRYHLPLMPIVFVYAAAAIAHAGVIWRQRRSIQFFLASALCVLLLASWGWELIWVDPQRYLSVLQLTAESRIDSISASASSHRTHFARLSFSSEPENNMPGLFGIVGPPHDEQSHDLCEAMCNRMRHHSWYQVDQHEELSAGIALGRVSLGFIQTRPQPVWNHDRSVCLLLDGEIYGEAELRRELLMEGVQLSTAGSHAELLLQGYLQEGRNFFRRVNGTFISAIWEGRQRRLTLVNDRFGMKPLYYTRLPKRFLFAAELKSLLADPAVSRESDPQGISQFFSFGQLLGESTLLREIKTLPPAAWLTYCQTDGQLKIDRYWKLTEIKVNDRLSQADFLNRIDAAFAKAVELRTNDSPALGISLSGGLDSRTILACIDHAGTSHQIGQHGDARQFGSPLCAADWPRHRIAITTAACSMIGF